MSLRAVCLGLMALSLACSPGGGGGGSDGGGLDGDVPPERDADGDGIGDDWEGRADNVDTDGDGTPDYLDTDSDDDGVPDAVEKGNGGGMLPPADSDMDGTYDFRDTDADGNGIPDGVEGTIDTDGDTIPDFQDLDNDGDSVLDTDEVGDPASPVDFDGDGLPDHLDIDSDDDTIGDLHEAFADTDGDGIPDRQDLDTDGDGWSDADEAGDSDPATPPVDTDGDEIPDFRDPDSDNDGLSDAAERDLGTARDDADTDGDGVTDLIEVAGCEGDPTCMDATDPTSSPRTRGNFVFFMPFEDTPDPLMDTLDFATDIRVADVYFIIDTTGSMSTPINNVRTSLSSPGGIIDQVRAEIADVEIGVGEFRDYGDARIYNHRQDISASAAAAQTAVNGLVASGGGDGPEGGVPALWSMATGRGVGGSGGYPDRAGCPAGTFGYPCFRMGAVPIAVIIADYNFHNGPATGNTYGGYTVDGSSLNWARALPDILAANMRVIGVPVGTVSQADLTRIAADTGAPVPVVASGGTVSSTVVDQIRTLASSTMFDISGVFVDDASDAVDTFAAFVDRLEAKAAGDAGRGCDARPTSDADGDGVHETFPNVGSGNRVCFDIFVKQNDTIEPTLEPQVFRATIQVLGDGFTELDSRDVFFLVPPDIEVIGPPI